MQSRKFGIYLLREENDWFWEWKIRAFPTGFDAVFCDVTKKEKMRVYYINVTNLTVGNGCAMIAVKGGGTYA